MSNRQEGERDADRDESNGDDRLAGSDGESTDVGGESTDADRGDAGGDEPQLPAPSPGLSPEQAIRIQLRALADNDAPREDAGITVAFNFAAPAYRKRVGGSLEEFADHLTSPILGGLVDHQDAKRGRLERSNGTAREKVVVTDEDGDKTTYEFTLERQSGGKYDACWMTVDVDLVYVGESPDHQHMPSVDFDGTELKCKEGEVLRNVLLRASGVSPHNSAARYANCNGRGLCGTCAVEVADGDVTEKTAQERRRLKLPPHSGTDNENYRLSCQCRVLSDLVVRKHEGVWGQHVEEYASGTEETPGAEPIRVTDEEYAGGGLEDVETEDEEDIDAEMDLSDEAESVLEETRQMLGGGDEEGDDEDASDETADGETDEAE